jgi:hypothetical protein
MRFYRKHESDRFTKNEWYLRILDEIIEAITSAGKKYKILIRTDLRVKKI